MNIIIAQKRLLWLFSIEQVDRIHITSDIYGNVSNIMIDVHGLTCKEAKQFIKNIINTVMGCCPVKVIHGYRHGINIKRMLRENFSNPYIMKIVGDCCNMGVTYLNTAY